MNKLFAIASVAILCTSCLYGKYDNLTDDPNGGAPVVKAPEMGTYEAFSTVVPEVSGLCLAQDGQSLWTVSDDRNDYGGIYSLSFKGESEQKLSILRDCEGITLNPSTGDIYIAVEREQTVYKVPAPAYSEIQKIGEIENGAEDTKGKGLEGISWYKNDTLLVANQAMPTVISVYSIAKKEVVRHIKITCATYLSDICYDPVDDVIWISDSSSENIFRVNMKGELINSYDISAMVHTGTAGKAEGLCVDRAHSCVWVGCDVSNFLFKLSFKF